MASLSKTAYSRVSVKSQTVLPRDVRERLGIKAGDRLRYRITDAGVLLEKATSDLQDDPFATFTEWASPDDDEAFADL
jgi:antitoxin PrlF